MTLRLCRAIADRQCTSFIPCRTVVAACVLAILSTGCSKHSSLSGVESRPTGTIAGQVQQSDLQLAQASFQRQAYGLAEKHFRLAVEENRKSADAWLGLAASYDQLRRFDLADRAYHKLRALTGDNAVVLNNLGYSHTLRGNFAKAESLLARAQRMAPDDDQVLENIDFLNRRRAAAG